MEARVLVRQDGKTDAGGVSDPVPWWSLTKTALAIALLRLSDYGRVSLDEPVEGEPYTPVQLLRHEAGLPDYGSLPSYHADVEAGRPPWSTNDLLKAVEAERPRYVPGRDWAYSNVGYLKVAQLIERASGLQLADALTDMVFSPAKITTARLATTPDDLGGVCMGDVVGYHPGWVYHGLVVGTVVDAARLLHGLLRGALVKPETLIRMLDRRPLPQLRSELRPDPAYGLGLMVSATNLLNHPVGHSGSGPGSQIAVYAQRETTSAMWATTTSGTDPEAEVFRCLRNGRF
ncbi:serine hydrolase domain-containing protein [Mesorhizobium sp. B2-1-5]|uniref:serine hydrolase domain-containing protein n=1 Tax=Mesorhizobium sp. B2-1-5 TaxID=2589969 RepID=UPI001129F5C0|nr:serine hydrolase domain-containing protein [Mesorhizobium sp. B2-1-5]TPM89484.1 beta-lactamase family protein [Mesorhizobium sp. B2-1-5]